MSSFKRNLLLGYTISILLLLTGAIASYLSIRNLNRSQKLVNNTNNVIKNLEEVISVLKDAETGQRGFLLTNNEGFLEPYNGAFDRVTKSIQELKKLTRETPEQQVDAELLSRIISNRLIILQQSISKKRTGKEVEDSVLIVGKSYMDQARQTVQRMQNREQISLDQRVKILNDFASATPWIIAITSLLAILVTVVSFIRLTSDFEKRRQLQEELEKTNGEISRRVSVIADISAQIAAGNYHTRVNESEKHNLGAIAASLDSMAIALEKSFGDIQTREWMQMGIAQLNEKMIGIREIQPLAELVTEFLTEYTESLLGAFFIVSNADTLSYVSGVGLDAEKMRQSLKFGEGIAGQAAVARKPVKVELPPDTYVLMHFAGGQIKPKQLIAIPVFYENKLKAVIEFASLRDFTEAEEKLFLTMAWNIGIALHSALDHQRMQELLHETQAQSEELQVQQEELENINSELESQTEKLQASEEELRVQQEELQQANQELEERSRLLEEKNELILERNLDIQKKAEELALSTKYKSEFLANMSHELRTPLNSILLLSRLLTENHQNNLNDEQIEYASVIQNSGKGLLTLIDEILDLSKIEAGKMDLDYSQIKLSDLFGDIKGLFSPLAKDKGIFFEVNIDEAVPVMIETDRLRLEQVLRNLISNALKFTRKGTVSLNAVMRNNLIAFVVKDTGIGIPQDKLKTIFEAFQQADGSTRRQYGGTGLGLSISRELARLLGGDITVSSEVGEGSEFIFFIPVNRQTPAEMIPAEQFIQEPLTVHEEHNNGNKYISENIPEPIPDDRESIKANDRVILIIDDDTAFAKSLLDYTRSKGYKGLVAVRGDEGVALAKEFLPMGILLDLQLPVKSGWDVIEELKSHPATRPIPVHMMSSHQVKNRSLTKGAVDFINKPFAFEQLGQVFKKIEDALSRDPKKVLIVEENPKHAKALAYFLESYQVNAEIENTVDEGLKSLNRNEVDCVILDMGVPAQRSYETLETFKKSPGFENLPIIIFTGTNLSHVEEMRIRKYADSIVIKTAHSYQRILDEVSLFLHLVEENKKAGRTSRYKKLGELNEVLKDKTVLVVDDDVRNIFSLTKSLESHEMNVISAIDGKDALHQLENNPAVDLVLMDMMMPEMDGYETTRRIRKNPKYKNLPIIAVTAKAMMGDREKCINAGASDYITKPVDIDQLKSLLRVWLYE
jgi:signal transduction histidine kinase/CheY-like chemotaxis protein/CHASE3 domain sensor protein